MRRSDPAAASTRVTRKPWSGGLCGPTGRRLSAWWTLAALLHLVALVLLLERPRRQAPHAPQSAKPSQRAIDHALAEARRARRAPAAPPKPKEAAPKPPVERPRGTIVELAPHQSTPPPPDARYLAERDSSVQKETSARGQPRRDTASAPAPSAGSASQSTVPMKPVAPAPPQSAEQQPARAPVPKSASGLRRAERRGPRTRTQTEQTAKKDHPDTASPVQKADPTAPHRLTLAQLIPSMGALAQQGGPPAAPIALGAAVPDVEEGGATLLNARAFRHAGYFNRMMRSVEQFWHPAERYQRIDPSGQVYGRAPRLTVLEVTLDGQGHLKDVRVRDASGIYFLDDEAVAAFRRAEPFAHPPAALAEQDGTITFSVGFHFHIH